MDSWSWVPMFVGAGLSLVVLVLCIALAGWLIRWMDANG